MKLRWKCCQLAVLTLVLTALSGCSGINASKSISPATFLLPGIMGMAPAEPQVPEVQTSAKPVSVQSMAQPQ